METELKLRLNHRPWRVGARACLSRAPARCRCERCTFDTADGRLDASGASLRLRLEGAQWVQTAKAAGDGALERLEQECAVGGDPAVVPAPDSIDDSSRVT